MMKTTLKKIGRFIAGSAIAWAGFKLSYFFLTEMYSGGSVSEIAAGAVILGFNYLVMDFGAGVALGESALVDQTRTDRLEDFNE